MADSWTPVLLCRASESAAMKDLSAVARVVSVDIGNDELILAPATAKGARDAAIDDIAVFRDAIGYVASGVKGETAHAAISALWEHRFGAGTAPALYPLREEPALAVVGRILSRSMGTLRQRNTGLMREIGLLRTTHDQTQAAFQKLETFFYANNRSERIPAMTLSVQRGNRPLVLEDGQDIDQRLPIDSSGLCDVAISIARKPRAGSGTLIAALMLHDSAQVAGTWEVEAERIDAGWLRLCLDRALPAEPQTATLRLTWLGEGTLALNASFFHPDPRFMPLPDAPMLAMQLWKYIPDARAMMPAEGTATSSPRAIERWNIGARHFKAAVPLDGASAEDVTYSEAFGGLMVPPSGTTPTVARLDRAARAGVRHLFGGIKVEQTSGPEVEFAYALHPSRARTVGINRVPAFAEGLMSEWHALPVNEWSEHHLPLAIPLDEDHDLFLLSRLVEGGHSDTPPAACFFNIVAQAGTGEDA